MWTPHPHGNQVLGDGNLHVIDVLRGGGALWKHAPFAHRYPVDWRTKKPIIQARGLAGWGSDDGRLVAVIRRPTMGRLCAYQICIFTTHTRTQRLWVEYQA
jgi:hypothetical protein